MSSTDITDRIARALRRSDDRRAFDSLLRALDEVGDSCEPSVVGAVVDLLDHPAVRPGACGGSRSVPTSAMAALKRLGPHALPGLRAALASREAVARRAVDTLHEIPGDGADQILIAALSHQSPTVRWKAAGALGSRRATAAVDALKERLDDTDANVQRNAAWALTEIRDRSAPASEREE